MTVYLVPTTFGLFLIDKDSKVVAEQVFYPSIEDSFSVLSAINNGVPIESLKYLVGKINELKADSVILDNPPLSSILSALTEIPIKVDLHSAEIKWFRDTQDSYLTKSAIVGSSEDILKFRQEVALKLSRSAISAASGEKDLLVKHAIDAIGEIDTSINLVAMRLREWYSLNFPSLSGLIEDHERFARIVYVCGGRSQVTDELLSEAEISEKLRVQILASVSNDIGADLKTTDLKAIQVLANSILEFFKLRKELEEYVSEMMKELAPNITELVGPLVGARLVSLAGSLKELARKPSSTVQIFGAEKALFRSLKTGADPPKHGVIFQVAEIHSAPYWQRGKIARALAGKLSIAARIDAYSDRNVGASLREQFVTRVKEIQTQNPVAPPPKPPRKVMKPKHRPERRGRRDWDSKKRYGGKRR
ncbi:MAG: C/D box methylation guide ribonucleoprotein complex aNOP56 subunit [Candidatus Thorarchaeota archaeon]